MGALPNRLSGVSINIPFVYGSVASPIQPAATSASEGETNSTAESNASQHTHRWRVAVRGVGGFDVSRIIRKVTFKLHESFLNATRVIEEPPFEVSETGWGEFEIAIKVHFQDPQEKPQAFSHFLRLYPAATSSTDSARESSDVIFEKYDEFIFIEPTEKFYPTLQECRQWHDQNVPDLSNCEPLLYREMQEEKKKIQKAISVLKTQLGAA